MDIEEAEVLFAQKLADCDPSIRKKAFSRLRQFVNSRMKKKNGFQRSDLITLWTGLYYCMWMQDKPLLHEELADRLCSLAGEFTVTEQRILYLDTFLETIGREWYQIDKWRVDKFMMLFRRLFRNTLNWLKSENWDDDLRQRLVDLYAKTLFSTTNDDSYPEEIKCHFASIYLDELDLVGVFHLSHEDVFPYLDVFIKLLATKISDLFFRSIVNEIFDAIMVDFAENSYSKQQSKSHRRKRQLASVISEGSSDALKIDYSAVADALLEIGKSQSMKPKRRKAVYNLVNKFRAAANGQDPYSQNIEILDDIGEEELDQAALRLLESEELEAKKLKRKLKEADKIKGGTDDYEEPFLGSDEEDEETVPVAKKIRKMKPRQKKKIDQPKKKKFASGSKAGKNRKMPSKTSKKKDIW